MGFWNWLTKLPTIPPPPRKTTRQIIETFHANVDPLCRSCGYNLRGLPVGRKCPECGNQTLESWLEYLSNRTGYAARAFWIFGCAMRWYRGDGTGSVPVRHITARDFCYVVRA